MSPPRRQSPGPRGTTARQALARLGVDFMPAPVQPSWARLAVATVVSIAGSLAADAVLVAIGTRVFPSTKGYVHFEFGDYARLTVIGVVVAVCGLAHRDPSLVEAAMAFFRMAIAVTLVLFLPDLWILLHGAPAKAVAVLICLHVAIALVTYNALVRIAPADGDRKDQESREAGQP